MVPHAFYTPLMIFPPFRFILVCFLGCSLTGALSSQSVYPVKRNGQWGLMDGRGSLLLPPRYDLIGNPDEFGYLVVQDGEQLGLLGSGGRLVLAPAYEDVQVLDAGIIAVLENGRWRVIDERQRTLLPEGYLQLRPLGDGFLAYRRQRGWGVVARNGMNIVPAEYEEVIRRQDGYFETFTAGRRGLVSATGTVILAPLADEIILDTTGVFLYRNNNRWGGVDNAGRPLFRPNFVSYRHLGNDYLLMLGEEGHTVVLPRGQNRPFGLPPFAEALPFSQHYLAFRSQGKIGLLSRSGGSILTAQYDEIQPFSRALFRVKRASGWGLVGAGDVEALPAIYDYISPLAGRIATLRTGNRVGLTNFRGEVLREPIFDRVEVDFSTVRAFRGAENGTELTTFTVEEDGLLREGGASTQHFRIRVAGERNQDATGIYAEASTRLLPRYEWFYEAANRRWGLRSRNDGEVVIAPTFSEVEVLEDLGFSLVGLPKATEIELERTSFRANRVFGLLLNEEGILITELNLIDLRVEDWRRGNELARCLFDNGKFGLVDRNGRIVRRDLAYVGEFRDGLAPISVQGRISGSLDEEEVGIEPLADFFQSLRTGVFLTDYTSYDQEFARAARLVCRNCLWGYVSTNGTIKVPPRFTAVSEFRRGRAIVNLNGQNGLIDAEGRFLIPPAYARIEPVLMPQGQMAYRLHQPTQREGLIDTLGGFVIPPAYDAVGVPSEGLVAVRKGNKWGFLSRSGRAEIPFTFDAVKPFSQGVASVQNGSNWTYIDRKGEVLSKAAFTDIGTFSEGLAWVNTGEKIGFIDTSGQFLIAPQFEVAHDFDQGVARVVSDGKYGLIDHKGQWVLRPKFADILPFQANGVAIARLSGTQNRYVLIDQAGRTLTGLTTYRQIDSFREGLARVKDQNGFGFIDLNGREVISTTWGQAESFSGGRAVVRQNGRCGYIDASGELVIPTQYSRCLDFEDDRAVVYRSIHNAGLIDRNGRELISPSLDRMLHFREGRGLMRDQRQGFYFITDKAALYDGYYDEARPFYHGVAAIRQGDRWGLINRKGLPLIRPRFSAMEPFVGGMARVSVSRLFGLVDANGREILPANFSYLELVGEELFRVEIGNEMGYLTAGGRWVWPMAK